MKRVAAFAIATGLVACTLARDLDYLTEAPAKPLADAGDEAAAPDAGGRTAEVMVGQLVVPRLLVQDPSSLYWVTSDGSLLALKKENETTPRTITNVGPAVVALAADGQPDGVIYYATGSQIFSVPKSGGSATPFGSTSPAPAALAIDDTYVFVMAYEEGGLAPGIVRFARSGGTKVQITGGAPESPDLFGMALDRDNVFWDEGDNIFRSTPKNAAADAGAAKEYRPTSAETESAIGPRAFAVDADAIYYSDGTRVRSMQRLPAAAPTTLVNPADDLATLDVIAIDESHVYALDVRNNGALWRNVKTGRSTPERLLGDLPKPTAIAVDATWIYVTVEGPEGKLLRLKKD